MHGEYKVPGGKLVALDLDVVDGALADVRLSGDFFLEPDEALGRINGALTGAPETASRSQLAQRIESALLPGDTLVGFDADAVAQAARRALGKATGWEDHEFEMIPRIAMRPQMHVALDEVLAKELSAGRRGPTFRFWEWNAPLVVIGSFQSFTNEIDPDGAQRHDINVVRRISGGGAMFMEPGNCITYSLVVPESLVDGMSFEESYAFLDQWVLAALREVGVDARYVPINDIASDKGKIGGAAQKRFSDGVVVHHVTMAYDIDADKMLEVLRIGRAKMSDKGTKSANKRVDPMRSQTGMPREDIISSFERTFASRYRTKETPYTDAELEAAERLVETKFDTDEWRFRVP